LKQKNMNEQELRQEATNIRDENREGYNSANRIGTFLLNLIDYCKTLCCNGNGNGGGATTYPLVYDLNGGAIANYNGGTPPGNYAGGTPITMPTTVPTKVGFSFVGWLESTTIGELLLPGASSNSGMISTGLLYVAQWTASGGGGATTYPLVYDLNGGAIVNYNGGTPPGNYAVGASITMPTTVPTKADFTFTGWLESTTIGELLLPGASSNSGMISTGLLYVAQWTASGGEDPDPDPVNYEVSYVAGGENVVDMPDPLLQMVEEGTSFAVAAAPTRANYTFSGWKRDDNSQIYQPAGAFTMPSYDIQLTAQWTDNGGATQAVEITPNVLYLSADGNIKN
jgi:uncharacterized repeat protein (TIGR02543 family)